jgi:hypothetical protein
VLLKAPFAARWCNQVAGWLAGHLRGAGEVDRGKLGANSTSQQPATGVPRYRANICVCTFPAVLPKGVFWPDHRLTPMEYAGMAAGTTYIDAYNLP